MAHKFALGLDIGTSAVKASLLDLETGTEFAAASSPESEMPISAPRAGWAEQDPERWWQETLRALALLKQSNPQALSQVAAVGITYQMHGLVLLDKAGRVLRPAIIWCDSRAVATGEKYFQALGEDFCKTSLLNSPGNFTAAKLAWVKENEPRIFDQIAHVLLPGDFIAYKLSGVASTSVSGLSEMILWNFAQERIAQELLDAMQIDSRIFPEIHGAFGPHAEVNAEGADVSGLLKGTPLTYRAGDQPNNAFSLQVLNPGEVAATAGTSGVVYGVSAERVAEEKFRVNTFVHVTHAPQSPRFGSLLCLNGCGITYSWLKNTLFAGSTSYAEMDRSASEAPPGSDGVRILPFGNGAERSLENCTPGAAISGLDFNRHNRGHLCRAAQEGIAFALNRGIGLMKKIGVRPDKIRVGDANLFKSKVFSETLATLADGVISVYSTDGAQGAARGAGVGCGAFRTFAEAFAGLKALRRIEPRREWAAPLHDAAQQWEKDLSVYLK